MPILQKIYHLINSLSRSEKRYFRQHAQLYRPQETADYMVLFDLISKQKTYQSKQLKKEIADKNIEYVSIKARYLYNAILVALTNYKKNRNTFIQLNSNFQKVYILESKGLFKEAFTLLKRIKKQARKTQRFEILYQSLEKEEELLITLNQGLSNDALIQVQEEKQATFGLLKNINDYEQLRLTMLNFFIQHNFTEDPLTIEQIYQKFPLLTTTNHTLCSYTQVSYHHLHNIIYYFLGHPQKMLDAAQRALELLPQIHLSPAFAFVLLQNYFVSCYRQPLPHQHVDFDGGLHLLNQLKFEEQQYQAIKKMMTLAFSFQYQWRIQKNISSEEGEKRYAVFEEFYQKHDKHLHWSRKKLFYHDLILYSVYLKLFSIGSLWLQRLENIEESKKLLIEEKLILRFFSFIFNYEANIPNLVKRDSRSISYFVGKIQHPFALKTARLFHELYLCKTTEKENSLFREYAPLLKEISPKLTNSLWSFEFVNSWVEQKI